jgi:hypothetical protein
MRRLLSSLVVSSLVALPALAAEVVVDDFVDAQAQISAPPTSTSFQAEIAGTIVPPGAANGERDLRLLLLGAAGTLDSTADVTGGQLNFSVPEVRSELFVSWDGQDADDAVDPTGLGGVDLTDGGTNNTFRLTVGAVTGLAELVVEVFTDASNSSRAFAAVSAAGDVFFPFGALATQLGTGADLTNVGAITLQVRSSAVGSFSASDFRAVGPGVESTKVDALLVDSDGDGEADPGETLRYQIDVNSTGGTATGVEVDDTVGSDLNFIAGSILVSPLAVNDGYATVGNVQLAVTNAALGLLANDFDPDDGGANFTVTAFDAVSLQGGTVAVAADGTFVYDAPVGLSGVDSFDYTITDLDGLTDNGTVNVLIEGTIWFVDDGPGGCGAQPCGSGTQSDPFGGFHPTQLNGAGGAGDLDGPDDLIFVFEGSGDTDTGDAAGFELEDGQTLHGEGVDLVVGGITIIPAGTKPILTNTGATSGHGITLAQDNTIRGLTVGGTPAVRTAFRGSADVGSLTIDDSDVSGTGGIFDVASGGALNVTFDSVASTSSTGTPGINISGVSGSFTVSNPAAGTDTSIASAEAGISIQNSAGAVFSFGETSIGTTSAGGDGVNLGGTTPSAGATFTFDDLAITTGRGDGLLANNSGTLNIGGTTSTISATTGAALDLQTMALDDGVGGGGVTFADLTSANSPTDGIRLDNLTGTFTAAGNVDIDDPTSVGIEVTAVLTQVTFSGVSKTITDGGAVPNGGGGVDLFSSNVDFTNGGLDIDTTTGIGFEATTGGTINVTGAGNTLNVGAASSALNLNGVTIGANDVTFASINATGVTGVGVDIEAVTGAGNDVDGGVTTISGSGDDCIEVDGATSANARFTSLDLNGCSANGVRFATTSASGGFIVTGTGNIGAMTGATLRGIDISGAGGSSFGQINIDNRGQEGFNIESSSGPHLFGTTTIDNQASSTASGIRISGTTGGSISFAQLNLDNNNAAARGVNIQSGNVATVNIQNASSTIVGTGGEAFRVSGGAASVDYAGAITNTSDLSVSVSGRTGGAVTLAGAIDDDGEGIELTGNSGGTITFRGGLDLDTSTFTGFNATGGGTVNVCATADCAAGTAVVNTITTTTGTAVNIQSTAIGADGVTLRSVDVGGGAVGIDIDGGGTGGFTVTGTGTTDGTGGTIQNTTQNGILIENTDNISISNMNLTNAADDGGGAGSCDEDDFGSCNAALELNTVSGAALANLSISGSEDHGIFGQTVTNLDISDTDVTGLGADVDTNEHAIFVRNLLGTTAASADSVFNNVTVDDAQDTAIFIENTTATNPGDTGNPDQLTVSNSQLTDAGDSGLRVLTITINGNINLIATGNTISNTIDGIDLVAEAGNAQGTVGGAGGLANVISNGAGGDMVNGIRFLAIASLGDATVNATATNNTITVFAQGSPAPVSGLNGIGLASDGASSGNLGQLRATATGNTINSTFSGILTQTVHGVLVNNEGSGTTSQNVITVDNNIITLNPPVGTMTAETVGVGVDGGTTGAGTTVRIDNNTIVADGDASNGASVGIQILPTEFLDPTGTNTRVCVSVTGNDVSTPNNPFAGAFGTTELDVIAAPVVADSFLDVEDITTGVRTPAQLVTDLEPLNTNTEVGDTTGQIAGVITGVTSCPN